MATQGPARDPGARCQGQEHLPTPHPPPIYTLVPHKPPKTIILTRANYHQPHTQVRKAQRETQVRAAKDKKREATAAKKTKPGFDKSASKAVKNVPKSAPRVGGKR